MASFTPWRRMLYHLCHVHETSPGTHTLFPTYTCPVYCWRSVQLLDFGLSCNLIHASQPVRTTFTGQWFASGFLQTPPHDDALAIGCTLPTAGRVRDFHPLERALAGHTTKRHQTSPSDALLPFSLSPLLHHRLCTNSIPFCRIINKYMGNCPKKFTILDQRAAR